MLKSLRRTLFLLLSLALLFFFLAECDVSLSGEANGRAAISYTLLDGDTGRLSLFGRLYTVDHGVLREIREGAVGIGKRIEECLPGAVRTAIHVVTDAASAIAAELWELLRS